MAAEQKRTEVKNTRSPVERGMKATQGYLTGGPSYLHCSSGGSDSTKGINNPYLKEVYRKHLEEKQHELTKLKNKLGKIQRELSLKHAFSKEKLIDAPVHEKKRSSSQSNKC